MHEKCHRIISNSSREGKCLEPYLFLSFDLRLFHLQAKSQGPPYKGLLRSAISRRCERKEVQMLKALSRHKNLVFVSVDFDFVEEGI
ncbi:hypothetical protein P8452_24434 [Trifolium repens]|nr:hypothetical protein P8452_24434 [Trifolium repens]